MEFVDTKLVAKTFFTSERSAFGSPDKRWSVRAKLRPITNIKARADCWELVKFLNHKMRVALTEWDDLTEIMNETIVQKAKSEASSTAEANRGTKTRTSKTK